MYTIKFHALFFDRKYHNNVRFRLKPYLRVFKGMLFILLQYHIEMLGMDKKLLCAY